MFRHLSETVSEGTSASEGATSSESSAESEGHSIVVYIDLWVFLSLALACAAIHLRSSVRLPISGLLLLAGILLRTAGYYIGMIGDTVKILDNIEAETIMLLFLPALISECAFQTDWYTFKHEFAQIILLATSAVVVSTIMTAVVVRYILGFDEEFGWYSALMLGAILSATDHVAVVAQLKEVNADDRLETLMQGETLVNDGTVIVIFTAMLNGAIGTAASPAEITEDFFRLSLGGMALGLGFGLMLSLWLRRLVNHAVLETLLTVVTTYLLFFTADATSIHFSGALATVTFGLYMSAYGKTLISPLVEKTVHEFWKLLGTCFEALTMILGGMLMGHFFMNFEHLEYSDIGALFGLFALLHVVRAITVLLHWPLLRVLGYGCTYKEMLVLICGALKGTISIALALMVFHQSGFEARVQDLVLFWSVGVSALSAFFDSLLLHIVVHALGLESLSDVQENMLVSVTTSILATADKHMQKLQADSEYSLANWEEVLQYAGPQSLLHDMLHVTKAGRKLSKQLDDFPTTASVLEEFGKGVSFADYDIVLETRRRFYTTLKGIYWHFFEHGECFGGSALVLIEAANLGLDSENEVMADWEGLERKIFPRRLISFLQWGSRLPLIGRLFRRLEYSYITEAYDIARNFIRGHSEAEEMLDDMEIDIKKEVFEEVMKEPQIQIGLAKQFLSDYIIDVYPEVYIFVQTKQVSTILLVSEQEAIEKAYECGVITEIEYLTLIKSVSHKLVELDRDTTPKPPSVEELLRSCYLFKDLSSERMHQLASNLKEELLPKGDTFSDEDFKGIYVVLKGRLGEEGKGFTLEYNSGDAVGVQFLLPGVKPPSSQVSITTLSKVVFVPKFDIDALLNTDPEFERKLWLMGAKKLVVMCAELFGELGQLDTDKQNIIFTNSSIVKYPAGAVVPLHTGTMFLKGGLTNGTHAPSYSPGQDKAQGQAAEDCVVLHFNEEFGKFVRSSEANLKTAVSKFQFQGKGQSVKMGGFKLPAGANVLSSLLFKQSAPPAGSAKVVPLSITNLDGETKAEDNPRTGLLGLLKRKPKEEEELLKDGSPAPVFFTPK